jgi:TatD DNase family protein
LALKSLIDSHVHLDHQRYDEDREAVLDRAWAAGVRGMLSIGIGDGPATMHQALELARLYAERANTPQIWASAGIHPQEAAAGDQAALDVLDGLLGEPEVIACGEIGLDYYHDDNPAAEVQKRVFRAQMEIAGARRKPILIHCRPGNAAGADADAWADTLAVLEEQWRPTGLGGVLHCFTGEPEHARRALELGFLISFAGNLTYPSAGALREIARTIPLDSLLVETDAPFLAPAPDRGKRNEPAFVARTAAQLGQLHGLEPDELAQVTSENFTRFFHTAETLADPR